MSDEEWGGGGGGGGGGGARRLNSSDSAENDHLFPIHARKADQEKSGKFILRAAAKEDPLHFIHRIVQSKDKDQDEQLYENMSTSKRNESTSSSDDENDDDDDVHSSDEEGDHHVLKSSEKTTKHEVLHISDDDDDDNIADIIIGNKIQNNDDDDSSIDFHSDTPDRDDDDDDNYRHNREDLVIKDDDNYSDNDLGKELHGKTNTEKDEDVIDSDDQSNQRTRAVDEIDNLVEEFSTGKDKERDSNDDKNKISGTSPLSSAAVAAGKVDRDFLKELKLKVRVTPNKQEEEEEDVDMDDGREKEETSTMKDDSLTEKFEDKNTSNKDNAPSVISATKTADYADKNKDKDEITIEGEEIDGLGELKDVKESSTTSRPKDLHNSYRKVVKELGSSLISSFNRKHYNSNDKKTSVAVGEIGKSKDSENNNFTRISTESNFAAKKKQESPPSDLYCQLICFGNDGMSTDENLPVVEYMFTDDDTSFKSESKHSQDLDFSAIESHSSTLNVEANKQRAALRQKGSLAGRRKPTRASLRANTATDTVIETVAVNNRNEEKLLNGHVEEDDNKDEEKNKMDEIKGDTNTSQAVLSQGPVLRTGKTIHGVKTAIILPGIADKSRLRASKPPVPLPRDNKDKDSEEGTSAPWMMESKLRRQSKPPVPLPQGQGETAKLQQEARPERPGWMKDAEMKRKRASNIITERDQQKEQKDKENEQEQDRPVAPWMKEAHLRKINRPGPMTINHKEILSNIDNVDILEHENPFKPASVDTTVGTTMNTNTTKVSSYNSSISTSDKKVADSVDNSSSNIFTRNSSSKNPVPPPRKHKSNREILQPIEKTDISSTSSSVTSSPVHHPINQKSSTDISSSSAVSSTSSLSSALHKTYQPIKKPDTSLQPIKKADTQYSTPFQPMRKVETSSTSSSSSSQFTGSLSSSPFRFQQKQQEQDENKPPVGKDTTTTTTNNNQIIEKTKEMPPVKSNILPPLKSSVKLPCSDLSNEEHLSSSSTTNKSNTSSPLVVMREKPNNTTNNNIENHSIQLSSQQQSHYTPKPALKRPITMGPAVGVESPMKMWETPQWKKDLMEKKKKRESITTGVITSIPLTTTEDNNTQDIPDNTINSSSTVDGPLPPWKRELEQRRSKRSTVIPTAMEETSSSEKTEERVPDWMKQVQRRRSRLADAGLIKDNVNGDR